MTQMSNEAGHELRELVKYWGMLGVLHELADICGDWSRHYDQSPATEAYRRAEININNVASDLFHAESQ
jgi:hypothetical protein